ncbi:hypothetical protein ACFQE1_03745 [Halobium palmae]|uniref:Uncharacterized protein n=1 Tax=Halobium palmae TaxID=1776492 RepID=A0ABD5RVY0_9EURY
MQEAHSWHSAFASARQSSGKKIRIGKEFAGPLPPQFTPSARSLRLGANEVYRDQQPTNSLQIREYDDHYTVQLDRHNPETGNLIQHALVDATAYTVGAAALGVALFGGGK